MKFIPLHWLPFIPLSLLTAVHGVPGTGALRTLLLLILVTLIVWQWHKARPSFSLRRNSYVTAMFVLFILWLVIHALFIAPDPSEAIVQSSSDWGKMLLLFAVGAGLAWGGFDRKQLLLALFVGVMMHVVVAVGSLGTAFLTTGRFSYIETFLGNYALISSFVTVAFAWLLADGLARIWHGQSLLPWSTMVTVGMFMLTLVVQIGLLAKSGHLVVAGLLMIAVLMVSFRKPGNNPLWTVVVLLSLGMMAWSIIGESGRWRGFSASTNAGWQQPNPVPAIISDSVQVPENLDHSPYVRATRFRVGLEGIAENPLGLGYTPDVFGRYTAKRFNIPKAIDSSNSGLIDFGLALGVPGILFLLLFIASLMWLGWQAFGAGTAEGIALVFLIAQHLARYALDGTLGGSRMTSIAIALGFLWGVVVTQKKSEQRGT